MFLFRLVAFGFVFLPAWMMVTPLAAQNAGFRSTFFTIDPARWYISNGWSNGPHQSCEWRADAFSIVDNKLVMTVSDKGGAVRPLGCPEMHTKEPQKYGLYEVRMRTAAGSGLNTAFFTYTGAPYHAPAHNEIDFEFLGKAPNTVQINYYTDDKDVHAKSISLGFDASKDFHTYAFDWSPTGIKWFVDNVKVYETPAGAAIPTLPSYLFLSLWTGSEVEDSWMGHFTYTSPVSATVEWARFMPHA